MKAAVLVIDMQKDFFTADRLKAAQKNLIENINTLTENARKRGYPVIWVRQEMKPDGSNAPLADRKAGKKFVIEGTEGAQLLDGLTVEETDHEIIKTRYSAFHKTNLEELLEKLGVDSLIVAGINTHACVRTAAIDAYQRDYEVILALDCIDSYDEEHHHVSIKYLSGKVARPMTNTEIADFFNKKIIKTA